MMAMPMIEHNKSGQPTRPVFENKSVTVCPQNKIFLSPNFYIEVYFSTSSK